MKCVKISLGMKKDKRIINILKISIFLVILIVGAIFLRYTGIDNLQELEAIIKSSGSIAPYIYIALFSILPSFFMPVTILAMAAGYVFGIVNAGIYTFIGAFINSTLTYFIGKYVAYDFINDIANEKYHDVYTKLKEKSHGKEGFILMIIVRLLPFVPYTLLNYMSGAVGFNYLVFISSTMIGILPGIFIYTNIGTNLSSLGSKEFYVSILIFVIFVSITTLIAKKYYGSEK